MRQCNHISERGGGRWIRNTSEQWQKGMGEEFMA